MKQCMCCGEVIEAEWEVYGEPNEIMCFYCWDDLRTEAQGYQEVYGIGPHIHDMARTGSIIGSTVFVPLEGEPDADGWYHISETVWYQPDTNPDGEGMGLWRYWLKGRQP